MFSLLLHAFAILFQKHFKILKFNKLYFLNCFLLNTYFVHFRHASQDICQKLFNNFLNQNFSLVNVSVEQIVKNCQLKLGWLFNTAYFVAKEKLPFRKYSKICNLQSKNNIVLNKNCLIDVA